MIGSAEIGETIMRALILRRVELIEEGAAGTIIIGTPGSPAVIRLQNFLARAGYPYQVLDVRDGHEGYDLIERFCVTPEALPLVVCPNGSLLHRPSEIDMARCIGITPEIEPNKAYDVAVVGAGPAAVYAAFVGERALGLAHTIYHRSSWTTGDYCYLQDLFVRDDARGLGVGRALIEHVYADAKRRGAPRVYWSTHETNHNAMQLYDRIADRSGFILYRKLLD